MAHFAELDENNIVLRVLVTDNNDVNEGHDWLLETFGGNWVQTSYNSNLRKNFAGIGYTYDKELDAFIAPKPYDSWILNPQTARWESPIPYPNNGLMCHWDEVAGDWMAVVFETEKEL